MQGFRVAARVGCGALRRGLVTTAASSLPPHAAVRGCTCGACAVVAAAGSGRAAPGEWARGRGCVALGLSMEAGGAAAAAVPEFELSDKTVEVGTYGSKSLCVGAALPCLLFAVTMPGVYIGMVLAGWASPLCYSGDEVTESLPRP